MLIPWLLLGGCLERVTGVPVPLDPRFTAQAAGPVEGGDDTGGPSHGSVAHREIGHEEVGPPKPFADVEGAKVTLHGTVVAERADLGVDIDVARPDKDKPGGLDNAGKLMLSAPGAFELALPSGVGPIVLTAFQDPDSDGPSDTDPFATLTIEIGETDPDPVTLTLEVGERTVGPSHVEAPPGAGSGQEPPPVGSPSQGDPFANAVGPMVRVSGTLTWAGEETIDVDLFTLDAEQPGGRRLLGKLKKPPGPFSIDVPVEYGTIEIEAFVDLDGDGPSPTDPTAQAGQIALDGGPITGVSLTLSLGSLTPPSPPAVGPGRSLEEVFEDVGTAARNRDRAPDGL